MTGIADTVLAALSHAPAKAPDIASAFRLKNKQVNNALVALQRSGRVRKIGEKRPFTWALADGVGAPDAARSPFRLATAQLAGDHDDAEVTAEFEVFVGRFATGDIQIGYGEDALRIPLAAARDVHRLLEGLFGPNE
jgi:hypothetical protein